MTPNNIVNMAILKGLDFIAITDHNTVGNARAFMECAVGKDIVIIPGMEIESSEEVHLICLFPDIFAAEKMGKMVYEHLPDLANRVDLFGEQLLFDADDKVLGKESRLLLTAALMTVEAIKNNVESLGGVVIPAHVDRSSFSLISNLGFIPENLNFSVLEISKHAVKSNFFQQHPNLMQYPLIKCSDAHRLEDISEAEEYLELRDKTVESCLNFLKHQ